MNFRVSFSGVRIPGLLNRERPTGLPEILTQANMGILAFRWLVVACQSATLLITWPLWQVHTSPPMLPAMPLPQLDMGGILFMSLALMLVKPLHGLFVHTALLVYAMLIDQTRMQPEVISLALLMWGTLRYPSAQALARAHLIALWFWAGFNKLLSPVFLSSTGPGLFATLLPGTPLWLRSNGGYFIALTELSLGLLAIFPRTRRLAAVMAVGVHTYIFLTLSPAGRNWNESVWPWNIALALAGLALIFPWRESLIPISAPRRRLVQALVVVILISPAGWFVGITDAYLAHHLYSSDVPRASSTALQTSATWSAFEVPLPPEHRLFEQYFQLTCQPGDEMTIRDRRWWFRQQGLDERRLTCPTSP